MSENNFHVDTLDIISAVVGGVAGFAILIKAGLWHFEEYIIIGCVVLCLGLKRLIVPTAPKRDDAPVLVRMLFLLLAIAGSAAGVLSFVFAYTNEAFMKAPSLMAFAQLAQLPLMAGAAALALAFFMERAYLR